MNLIYISHKDAMSVISFIYRSCLNQVYKE